MAKSTTTTPAGLTARDTKPYVRKKGPRAGTRVKSDKEALLTVSLPKDMKIAIRGRATQADRAISEMLRYAWTAQEERGWADVETVQVMLKKKGLLKPDGKLVDDIKQRTEKLLAELEGES